MLKTPLQCTVVTFICSPSVHFPLIIHQKHKQYESVKLKYSVDEENLVVLPVSSSQVDSRVPKHFWLHCLFMNSLCFFLMLKTLQATFPTSVSPLICNCTCHLKSTRHGRQAHPLITQRFQSTNALSWLSWNSSTSIMQSCVSTFEFAWHKRHNQCPLK